MEFLRRHAFYIICGLAAVGGIALAATGLNSMPKVVREMESGKGLIEELDRLQVGAANQDSIAIQEERIDRTVADRDAVFAQAKGLYHYKPLMEGVFPTGSDNSLRRFRVVYTEAMEQLFASLNSTRVPTQADLDAMKDKIADEEYRAQNLGADAGAAATPPEQTGPPRSPAGVLTKAGARKNAEARAAMALAQSYYCYAIHHTDKDALKPNMASSLSFHVEMVDTGLVDAPYPEDVWGAQMDYWLQKDVVDAIVAVNNEAASAARARGETIWIGMMPVKEVVSIRTSEGFILPDAGEAGGAPASGFGDAFPPTTGDSVFTKTSSTRTFEVMQFTVKLVMDQRDILKLVEKLTTGTFHTLLRVSYSAVPPNLNMTGKVYGSEPTVLVVMDFETVLLGEVFRPLMPPAVREVLESAGYGAVFTELEEEEEEETDEEG